MGRLIILNDRQSGKTTNLLQMFFRNQNSNKILIVNKEDSKSDIMYGLNIDHKQIQTINSFVRENENKLWSNDNLSIYIDELFFFNESLVQKLFEILKKFDTKNIVITSSLKEGVEDLQINTISYLCKNSSFELIDFRKNKKIELKLWGIQQ